MKKFLLAAATAAALVCGASVAQAAEFATNINQAQLDAFGTSAFGMVNTSTGVFSDTFDFTTGGPKNASSFVGSIVLGAGTRDIDFSSIDLDGTFFFTQVTGDPNEQWQLLSAVIGSGLHHIHVNGTVVATGETSPASYSGTLNLGAVPEPATWGLMIMGFGGIGAMIRSRRKAQPALA